MSIGFNVCNIQSLDDRKPPEEKSTMRECLFQLHCTKHLDPLKTKYIPQCQHSTQPIHPQGDSALPLLHHFHSAEPPSPLHFPPILHTCTQRVPETKRTTRSTPKKSGQPPCVPHQPVSTLFPPRPPELDQSTYTVSRLSTLEVVHRKQSIQYPLGRGKYIPHSLWAGPSHPV